MEELERIWQYLNDHDIYPEYVDRHADDILILVNHGDWKHEHLYCDYLLNELGYTTVSEYITDDDGSDCYSALHTYRMLK
jgi:hypothetical protein